MIYTTTAAAAAVATYLFYLLLDWILVHRRRRLMKKTHGCLPPRKYSQSDPFLGTDVVLQNIQAGREHRFLHLLKTRHEENGPTFTTDTYFRKTINTCDPQLIRSILTFQFNDFGMGPLRQRSAAPLLGQGIFTTDNEVWAHQRALIRPSFARAQVADFTIFESHVDQLIALIKKGNYAVDLQPLFFRMVLDSNSEYMFGESVGLLDDDASDWATTFHDALDYAEEGTILRLRLGNLMWFHWDRKFRASCLTVHEFAQRFVDKALDFRRKQALRSLEEQEKAAASEARQKYVFLDELAKNTEDPIMLRDHIVNMLLAARDTTAGLLSFTFYMLSRRKDLWQKTRADVLEHYCEPLTYEAVMEMTYVRYFLQETLRMFPPIATNSRVAHRDTVLPVGGGPDGKSPLFMAKHHVVTWSTYVMHRRKELFGDDAEEFRPERWETIRPTWEYIPFNGGPRICPGQKFALTEASYTVARLLHAFAGIESIDDTEWQEKITLSLTLKDGVHCRFME